MPRQADDPDPQPTIAIHGRMLIAGTLVEATQRRFRHELTHRFLDHRVRWSPPWLEEGLAEYYSTLKVDGSDAVVGTLPNTKILRVDIHSVAVAERRDASRIASTWPKCQRCSSSSPPTSRRSTTARTSSPTTPAPGRSCT